MLHRMLIALAFLVASTAMVSAQDIFLSFGQGADVSSTLVDTSGSSGSAFVYVRNGFDLFGFDLDFAQDNSSVIQLTGATVFNDFNFGPAKPLTGDGLTL